MKLRRYVAAVLAATPAAVGLLSAPQAAAECISSGGSTVCADGQVRGADGGSGTDAYGCGDEYRNSDAYRDTSDYHLCVDGTWGTTWTVVPPPVGPGGPVAPILPGGPG